MLDFVRCRTGCGAVLPEMCATCDDTAALFCPVLLLCLVLTSCRWCEVLCGVNYNSLPAVNTGWPKKS